MSIYRQSQTARLGYLCQWVTDRLVQADVEIQEYFLEMDGRLASNDEWVHPRAGAVLRVNLVRYGFHRNRGPPTETASSSLSSVSWLRAITNSEQSDQIPGGIGEFYPQPGDPDFDEEAPGLHEREDEVSLMQQLFVLHGGGRDCQMAESDWLINARSHILMCFGVQQDDWANTVVRRSATGTSTPPLLDGAFVAAHREGANTLSSGQPGQFFNFLIHYSIWPGVIQPCYVHGHCGDPGNESADVLSKHAAQNSFQPMKRGLSTMTRRDQPSSVFPGCG